MLTEKKLQSLFRGDFVGKEIIFHESTESTNKDAAAIIKQRKHPEGTVVIADRQTGGRGRLGRSWFSPPGLNLYFTVIVRAPDEIGEASLYTLAAAVGAASAIRGCTGLQAGIKWPNDILINGRKAGGILLELKQGRESAKYILAGTGINVNMTSSDIDEEIRETATSLMIEHGRMFDRAALLDAALTELDKVYKALFDRNKQDIITRWLDLNCTIGNRLQIRSEESVISGTAEGISDSGALILRLPSGEIRTIHGGDVTIIKDGQ